MLGRLDYDFLLDVPKSTADPNRISWSSLLVPLDLWASLQINDPGTVPRATPAPFELYAASALERYPITKRFVMGGVISNSLVRRLTVP
jgi:hypothetical protein